MCRLICLDLSHINIYNKYLDMINHHLSPTFFYTIFSRGMSMDEQSPSEELQLQFRWLVGLRAGLVAAFVVDGSALIRRIWRHLPLLNVASYLIVAALLTLVVAGAWAMILDQ